MGKSNQRWRPDELTLVSDLSIESADIAAELGRSIGAVVTLRRRMAEGWKPRKAFVPLTDQQTDFIAEHPEMTARTVADELGVPYPLVTKARRALAKERGISFGTGPYDKSPHMVGARLLLGKTCPACGVLRGGADFHRNGSKTHPVCRFCRSETRKPDDRTEREERVRKLAPVVGVVYRSLHGEEYTEKDMTVLSDPTLSLTEKAARLGRTYAATCMAAQQYGFSSKVEERAEPHGVWIVDAATQEAAQTEPNRSDFGKRARKTHCKWGHELTPDNLYHPKNRAPDCLRCRQIRNRRRTA